jgi:hypothetical protein
MQVKARIRDRSIGTAPDADPLSVRATANSYLGLMRHANAWRERGRFACALKAAGYRTDRKLERLILKKATP